MKIVLLSTNICSVPTCQFLQNTHMLQAVVSTTDINPYTQQFEQMIAGLNVPFHRFSKAELKTSLKQLLEALTPDVVLVFAYAYKIPEVLFGIPKFGFYNVHYSLLPRYRGRCPVFWQLRNGDPNGGISIHQVTNDFDKGGILMQKQVDVLPGTSHGIFWGGLSLQAVSAIEAAMDKLKNSGHVLLLEQDETAASQAPAPQPGDLKISWQSQSAQDIENLVNACNPDYGGALTMLRGQLLRIFEVTRVELNMPQETTPGTIVYSDPNHGLFISCKDKQFLRINIIQSNEGILSGFKLAGLGIQAGEQLQDL